MSASVRTADFVVAGGGTAGCIVARRLADAGAEVILLEAGPSGEFDERVLRLGRSHELMNSELDWNYRTCGGGAGNAELRYNQAKVLGGCSSHNTAIAFRTPDWDLRGWEAAGADGWGPRETASALDRVYAQITIEGPDEDKELARAFVTAGQEWGLSRRDFGDPNLRSAVGFFKLAKQGEFRHSSATAYLFPLASLPPNLSVCTNEVARRIVLKGSRVVGVETSRGLARAREEIVLASGVFQSPKLLMLSGIGPSRQLERHGIDVVLEHPGVGQFLTDHPGSFVLWESTRPDEGGISDWEAGAFACLGDAREYPDLEFHFTTVVPEVCLGAVGIGRVRGAFSLHPNVTRPRSRGQVGLRSADPVDDPMIEPNWYTDPQGHDEMVIVEGIRRAREIANQPALRRWIARELAPGREVQDDEDLARFARRTASTSYHPAGTCRMGADGSSTAVVDPRLRVRGIENLRIADTSIFPSIPTPNPVITTMMVGERCAEFILADHAGNMRR